MRNLILNWTLVLGLAGCGASWAEDSKPLDWILGCWESSDSSAREVWVRDSEHRLIGFSVALKGGQLVFHEVLSIHIDDAGYHYTAYPSGQTVTTFSTPGVGDQSAVFANPAQDYPQRIEYRREGSRLRATISLIDGGNPNRFDKRPCP